MSFAEKLYSIVALLVLLGLVGSLASFPGLRTIGFMIPAALAGVVVNAGLLFLVFRDIFSRRFPSPGGRYVWALLILFFLPAVVVYLPKYGFKPREPRPDAAHRR